MLRRRPGANSSAMRGTTSWPRGASMTTVAVDDARRQAEALRRSVAASSSGARRARGPRRRRRARAARRACRWRSDAPPSRMRDAVAALGLFGLVRGHDDRQAARSRRSAPSWSQIRRSASGSTPRPGSSSSSSDPGRAAARARSRCAGACRPSRSTPPRRRASPSSISASASSMRRAALGARQAVERGAEAQVLAPGQLEVEARLLEDHAEARAVGRRRRAWRPRRRARSRPPSGGIRPESRRKAVVLPAPLGPSRPKISPGRDLEAERRRARRARRSAGAGRARADARARSRAAAADASCAGAQAIVRSTTSATNSSVR